MRTGNRLRWVRKAAVYTQAAMAIPVSTGLCVWGGYWFDSRFGWEPIGIMLGFAIGFTAGLIGLIRVIRTERDGDGK